jgi:single-stranded-DNA-specific exonuclease RecJ
MSKKKINLPMPKVKSRPVDKNIYNEALELGMTTLQAKIVASRPIPEGTNLQGILFPSLKHMPSLELLKDINKAASRIADAIINKETIGLLCDFDVDGISSCAVLSKALTDYFGVTPYRIKYFISNRMQEGYGFTEKVLDRVMELDEIPTLLITADQGSSDGKQVDSYLKNMKKLKIKNASVVVTDHHEIPAEIDRRPVNAAAFVNPQQEGDEFPDKTICGCTVALFVMAVTRTELIKRKYLDDNSPRLLELLSYSTAATIADCVSMASETNRAIVTMGLKEINEEKIPAWRIMRSSVIKDPTEPVRAESIGFGLGPRINACSRTGGDGLNAVRYYLSETDMSAQRYFDMLNYNNEERKKIELKLVEEAIEKAAVMVDQGALSLVIFLPNGHHGIHGIVASRVVEKFGRPVICLSPKEQVEEQYTSDHIKSIEEMERSLDKNFDEVTALRATYKHPKNKTSEFVITKKEDYKERKGRDRISEVKLSQKIFNKAEVISVLNKEFQLGVTKTIKEFYSLDKTHYIRVNKKNKTDYIIITGEITVLSGSARSIDGLETEQGKEFLDLHHCLTEISFQDTSLFLGFGGHSMAAGMGLNAGKMESLSALFEQEVRKHITVKDVGPKIFIDGELPYDVINLDLVDELLKLEPYGRSFDYPTFAISGFVESIDIVGKNKDTGKMSININNVSHQAMWFKYTSNAMHNKIHPNQRCRFVVRITDNFFRGNRKVSLQVVHAVPY